MKKYFIDTSALIKIYHKEVLTDMMLPLYKGNDKFSMPELPDLAKFEMIS